MHVKKMNIMAELLVLAVFVLIGFGFVHLVKSGNAIFVESTSISTSLYMLPLYALLSLSRSLIALIISYIFAISYGTLASSHKKFEGVLIPILDILQSIPMIAFLPGFILALISLFPSSRWGIELACILTIFTGQVWNLALAYYESKKTMQPEFNEISKIYSLKGWQKFFLVDLPNGSRPLIYNGMMSMAGGWFFITTCEAFTLGNKDFRLPGLGSYIIQAFSKGLYTNFTISLLVLVFVIIATDLILWKPLIAWIYKYRDSDDGSKSIPLNFFAKIIFKSNIFSIIYDLLQILYNKFTYFILKSNESNIKKTSIYYIVHEIKYYGTLLKKTHFISTNKVKKIKHSTLMSWAIIFIFGGLFFLFLLKLPYISKEISVITSDDWLSLIEAVFYTSLRVFCSLLIAIIWTLPVGIFIGISPKLEKRLQPIIQNLAAFPAPVLFPLLALLLRSLNVPNFFIVVLLMSLGSQWYILFNIIGGASRISADLKFVTKVYDFNRWQRFKDLYLPAVLPALVTGSITAAGGSWNASMVAEYIELPKGKLISPGIGSALMKFSSTANYPMLVAGIICLVVILIIINRTIWSLLYRLSEQVKD